MTLAQLVTTIIFFAWMFLVAGLLWIHAIRSGRRIAHVQIALTDANMKSAQAAHEAAEAAHKLADILEQKHASEH